MELEKAGAQEGVEQPPKDATFVFPIWQACRRKHSPDSPFFASGNLERELLAKQVILELTDEEKLQISCLEDEQHWKVKCPVVGCKATLNGLRELETHFFSRHTAVCSVCSRVFPTSRLLDLHISETHDSFFRAKAARGHPMFRCLVEGCEAKFLNDASRHQHLVDKHKFPKSYEFHKKRHLSQKQRQRLHPHQGGMKKSEVVHATQQNEQTSENKEEASGECAMEVEALTSAVSKLSTHGHVPSNVSFGRRHNRGFAFVGSKGRVNQKTNILPIIKILITSLRVLGGHNCSDAHMLEQAKILSSGYQVFELQTL
ncbi:hypothetical protein GOP47_0023479 [Adiantum capillus-veneris]|uniref:C2H2-type domain-containing protein n=1 Tax=Adiantum capillus-veneris TaxID=13818 RepID=A0A9D4U5R4_ADICA|nr:hypothetical protein GOP47_0023479 [Adiantum capillus-veneris]